MLTSKIKDSSVHILYTASASIYKKVLHIYTVKDFLLFRQMSPYFSYIYKNLKHTLL
ncbi:hypothetical protein SAMN04487911_11590 [Arenibacter nanhaiticus]|uniref:Uncharacterized protein n=1 Tax=Arenibacter nanhaiticus TaxID=558155 RepID=A0A1M6HZ02_9FLAO|nr:hypothetical protein SAMN04487911_11590 [Arenibacter nanhaiticus]